MKSKSSKGTDIKGIIISLIIVLVIILIFTTIDYFVHSLSQDYAVPSYYFRNKIIFGTIIGFIAYLFVKNKPLFIKSLIFSAAVAILLQIRYFIQGYSLSFVLEFLIIHFIILLPVSYIIFRLTKEF